jgi:inward rectifier potassium channel
MAIEDNTKFNDLGLDTKDQTNGYRSLNKDGTFKIQKINVPLTERINIFHWLITMSWSRFLVVVLIFYFLVNLIFASIYVAIGVENLTGVYATTPLQKFLEAFFFSAQTMTTLGYGRVAPLGFLANTFAAVESMLGLLAFALATGMVYGRFSKPSAKFIYSNNAVIAPYQDINGFMFRVANPLNNQLIEVEATLTLSMHRPNSQLRDFYLLELERPKVVFMPTMWTIVHPITSSSPLYKMTIQDYHEKDLEFIIMLKAFDESFSQTVYSRSSYKANEINWGQKFVYAISFDKGQRTVDLGKIDETTTVKINA